MCPADNPPNDRCAPAHAAALEREARRVFDRYSRELIEGYNLCPWAQKAREEGRVLVEVWVGEKPPVSAVSERVSDVGYANDADIAFFLFPESTLERAAFERYVGDVQQAYRTLRGQAGTDMALVPFHPVAEADTSASHRLVPLIRRTPDPTIQAIRLDVLERLRQGRDRVKRYVPPEAAWLDALKQESPASEGRRPLHESVGEHNLATVTRVGVEAIVALLDDIRRDRDQAYARVKVRG
jgi:hypothetical protein